MRSRLIAALFCVLGALLCGLLWREIDTPSPVLPQALVSSTVEALRCSPPTRSVDLDALYPGRRELLDAATALPSWHRFDPREARAVAHFLEDCEGPPPESRAEPLRKAIAWHLYECAHQTPPPEFTQTAPFMHPSGRSYARLMHDATWLDTSPPATDFHVLEQAELDREPDRDSLLAALDRHTLRALHAGNEWLVIDTHLVRHRPARHPSLGTLDVLDPAAVQNILEESSAVLRQHPTDPCAHSLGHGLCLQPESVNAITIKTFQAGFMLFALAALALLLDSTRAYAKERRRVAQDRVFIIRALSHELRTPATSLALALDPLRDAYDELPESCQTSVLSMVDDTARLQRSLRMGQRTMRLLDEDADVFRTTRVDSWHELARSWSAHWPTEITLRLVGDDGPWSTDPEWLGVAVGNLVENATRHGKPPIEVEVRRDDNALLVCVSDGGQSQALDIDELSRAYARGPESGGLGLGLFVVQRVAEGLGGRLEHRGHPTQFSLRVRDKEPS